MQIKRAKKTNGQAPVRGIRTHRWEPWNMIGCGLHKQRTKRTLYGGGVHTPGGGCAWSASGAKGNALLAWGSKMPCKCPMKAPTVKEGSVQPLFPPKKKKRGRAQKMGRVCKGGTFDTQKNFVGKNKHQPHYRVRSGDKPN